MAVKFLDKTGFEKVITKLRAEISSKLSLSGGTMTGALNVPTPSAGDNSTRVATTAFVNRAISNIDSGLPECTAADTGKILMVDSDGNPVWSMLPSADGVKF